jgi:acetyl/propionyl-CoA carboxylase alpha subunit
VEAGRPPGLESGRVKFEAQIGDDTIPVEVSGTDGRYQVLVAGEPWQIDARESAPGIWSLLIDGASYVVDVTDDDGTSVVEVDGESYRIRVEEETRYIIRTRGAKAAAGRQVLKAPMPGRVTHIEVEVGRAVQPGDGLIVLEAMKMENEFKATVAGTVREILVQVGQAVNPGDVLIVIE